MDVSINGWPVLSVGDARLARGVVPGTRVSLTMRREVLPLFLALAADYNEFVAPLRSGECGAFARRTARQAAAWSDHSSGTAVDLNWGHEGKAGPNGGMVTMDAGQIRQCAQIKRFYGLVLWGGDSRRGGDYHDPGSWDPMHYALRPGVSVDQVRARIKELGIRPDGTRATRPKK